MDELELLKSHWQKDGVEDKHLSSEQLYPMLVKKSSSIVKTLFYISIAEMAFWIIVNLLPVAMSQSYRDKLETMYGDSIVLSILTVVSWVIIPLFVYLLFKSYKSISVTDNAKKLMASIIKTRKVVKYYVLYNLIMVFVSMLYATSLVTRTNPELAQKIESYSNAKLIGMFLFVILITIAFMGLIWLFYKLLYGILLKRLNKNYKELKKLEV